MTPYSKVYDRFERQITDFDLQMLIPASKAAVLLDLLKEAIVMYFASPIDLTDRNDTTLEFTATLTELQEQILANYMTMAWIKPWLNNQDLFETHFSTQEYNEFSPANRMKELRECMKSAEKTAAILATKQSVKNVIGGLG